MGTGMEIEKIPNRMSQIQYYKDDTAREEKSNVLIDLRVKTLERKVSTLEDEVKELNSVAPTFIMVQRMDELSDKVDEVLKLSDLLRSKASKLIDIMIDSKNDVEEEDIQVAWKRCNIPILQITRKFGITLDYAQKLIEGKSENVSLKKKLLSFLNNNYLVNR